MKRIFPTISRIVVLVWFAFPISAAAQPYPVKPIRTVLGVTGGGEIIARLIAQKVSEALGQPVLLDAQAGAGGSIGAAMVARAVPDGYTILFTSSSAPVYRVFLAKSTLYDPVKDFTPISKIGDAVLVVAANPSVPFKSLADLVEYARRNPGKLFYATPGMGTTSHLSAVLLSQVAGIQMTQVPYKDSGRAATDLIGGQVPVSFAVFLTMAPHISSGKARILAVNNSARYHLFPDIPTVSEQVPGYEPPAAWLAYFGPAGLPQPVIRRLNTEIVRAIKLPDVSARFDSLGLVPAASTPDELGQALKRDLANAAKVVKAAGIEPE